MTYGRVGGGVGLSAYALVCAGLLAITAGVAYPTGELLAATTPASLVTAGVAFDGRSLVVGGGLLVSGAASLVLGGLLVAVRR